MFDMWWVKLCENYYLMVIYKCSSIILPSCVLEMFNSHFHLNVPIPNVWCPESILQKILVESGNILYIYQKCMYAD